MPRVTNRKINYKGKDGARLKCSIRSDSSGGCRYARVSGMRPSQTKQDYFSIDVCVDCGTVYHKNSPGFRVESSEADRLRLALFEVQKYLRYVDVRDNPHTVVGDLLSLVNKALRKPKNAKRRP
jgi:hypothetical protein